MGSPSTARSYSGIYPLMGPNPLVTNVLPERLNQPKQSANQAVPEEPGCPVPIKGWIVFRPFSQVLLSYIR